MAFGPALVRALRRFRARLDVTWLPVARAGAARAARPGGRGPVRSRRRRSRPRRAPHLVPARRAERRRRLRRRRGRLDQLHTSWAVLGLAAAGRDPRTVRRNGRSAVDSWSAHRAACASRRATSSARSSRSPPRAARRAGCAGATSSPSWWASAARRLLRRPGHPHVVRRSSRCVPPAAAASGRHVRAAARWVAGEQNADGGFNFRAARWPERDRRHRRRAAGLVAAGRRASAGVQRAATSSPASRTRTAASRCRPASRPTPSRRPGPSRASSPRGAIPTRAPPRWAQAAARPTCARCRPRRAPSAIPHEPPDPGLGHRAGAHRAGARRSRPRPCGGARATGRHGPPSAPLRRPCLPRHAGRATWRPRALLIG